jgi:hypothetical protein
MPKYQSRRTPCSRSNRRRRSRRTRRHRGGRGAFTTGATQSLAQSSPAPF